eukprot:TRINITY_DN8311_c0_g1_i1.p1 TRINITY_DN8311_c0_g1~~TRINITY_DN8311_c0_g1_i1.p1  ORF type:complete len:334 (-),score=82.49 TRINITY_DN8311_c0_g1_i1:192-1193(-)
MWRLIHHSRLAESVRVRVGDSFKAESFAEMESALNNIPWGDFITRTSTPKISVSSHKSRLYHTDAVKERIAKHLNQNLPEDPSNSESSSHIFARLENDICQLSIDATGDLLHRRTSNKHITASPLRETLAAAMVHLTGFQDTSWDSSDQVTIWDPFCGSGTIPLEFAGISTGNLIHRNMSSYHFQQWPGHRSDEYDRFLKEEETKKRKIPKKLKLIASDIDPRAISATSRNFENMFPDSAENFAKFRGDFEKISEFVPRGAMCVTNLPYGIRENYEVSEIFRRFGKLVQRRPDLRFFVLNGNSSFQNFTEIPWKICASFSNRGLPVQVLAPKT